LPKGLIQPFFVVFFDQGFPLQSVPLPSRPALPLVWKKVYKPPVRRSSLPALPVFPQQDLLFFSAPPFLGLMVTPPFWKYRVSLTSTLPQGLIFPFFFSDQIVVVAFPFRSPRAPPLLCPAAPHGAWCTPAGPHCEGTFPPFCLMRRFFRLQKSPSDLPRVHAFLMRFSSCSFSFQFLFRFKTSSRSFY